SGWAVIRLVNCLSASEAEPLCVTFVTHLRPLYCVLMRFSKIFPSATMVTPGSPMWAMFPLPPRILLMYAAATVGAPSLVTPDQPMRGPPQSDAPLAIGFPFARACA